MLRIKTKQKFKVKLRELLDVVDAVYTLNFTKITSPSANSVWHNYAGYITSLKNTDHVL